MELHPSHKALLSQLLQDESWKIVMLVLGERLATYERQMQALNYHERDYRLMIMERRNEVLYLVNRLYALAGEDNPFEKQAAVMWATEFKLPAWDNAQKEAQTGNPPGTVTMGPRKTGGSVA